MEEKGAIQEVQGPIGFVSNVFLVPKKDGGWRPIINLKSLNNFVASEHFKMEDIRVIKDILQPKDYLAKLDLKDAYFAVPIAVEDRKFLQFEWAGKIFEFTCLPFGLASAPRTFTKLLRPVMSQIREQGIRCLLYLDDMLVLGSTPEELTQNFRFCQGILSSLGFTINWKKSIAGPTQKIEFLGFIINSIEMTLAVPSEKLKGLQAECRKLKSGHMTTVRTLAHVIGLMTSVSLAILPAPLHYRGLQFLRNEALDRRLSYESSIALSKEAIEDLEWWCSNLKQWNGHMIQQPSPQVFLETDASDFGWGVACPTLGQKSGGHWSQEESKLHINCKELLAAWLGLQAFVSNIKKAHIHIKMDNTCAVAYLNRKGGVHSKPLCKVALSLWQWCLDRQLTVSAEHLPGIENIQADTESRRKLDSSEWELDQEVFLKLMRLRGSHEVDLFASRLSTKLPRYYSWRPDPGAEAVNALTQNWTIIRGYAFPPFCLIGRCLTKIQTEGVPYVLLITPLWKSQPWFPILTSMVADIPVLLPMSQNILKNPRGELHPLAVQGHLQLVAWSVSGIPSKVEAFQKKLSRSSAPLGEPIRNQPTPVPGRYGGVGVPNMASIPFQHL